MWTGSSVISHAAHRCERRVLHRTFAGLIPSFWQGELDEVATYPTVLTAAQIAKHYAARTLGAPPKTYADYVIGDGAVSYYRLGELTGAIAHDTQERRAAPR
jgi:hypothetical protein